VDVNPAAFDLAGHGNAGAARAVLLIHGFTGTPYEMRFLGEALAARGLRAVGPLLPGHGADAAALNRTTARDWLAAVERARAAVAPVAIVGLSLGGLLALELARAHPELEALCVLGTPLWLPRTTVLLARTAARVARAVPKLGGSDIRDRGVKASFPSLAQFPLAALGSLIDFMPAVRARVPEITVPALVMHAERDHVAPFGCALELHDRLGAADKRFVALAQSFHIITVDVERDRVAREVGDFIMKRIR
jgi:carboxylesterase